jgi:hypothetical protein
VVSLSAVLPRHLMHTVTRGSEYCLHVEQTFALDKLSMRCLVFLDEIIVNRS